MDERIGNQAPSPCSIFGLIPKWYRVYVNDLKNRDSLWSVDEGTVGTERYCFKVIIASTSPVGTDCDLSADNVTEPKAWISVFGVARELKDHKGRVIITITRK